MDSVHSQGSFQTSESGHASNKDNTQDLLPLPVGLVSVPGGSVEPALFPRVSQSSAPGRTCPRELSLGPTEGWGEFGILFHFRFLCTLCIPLMRLWEPWGQETALWFCFSMPGVGQALDKEWWMNEWVKMAASVLVGWVTLAILYCFEPQFLHPYHGIVRVSIS